MGVLHPKRTVISCTPSRTTHLIIHSTDLAHPIFTTKQIKKQIANNNRKLIFDRKDDIFEPTTPHYTQSQTANPEYYHSSCSLYQWNDHIRGCVEDSVLMGAGLVSWSCHLSCSIISFLHHLSPKRWAFSTNHLANNPSTPHSTSPFQSKHTGLITRILFFFVPCSLLFSTSHPPTPLHSHNPHRHIIQQHTHMS